MNRPVMDTPVITPYRMSRMLVGIMTPWVPPVATMAPAKPRGYLRSSRDGTMTPPTAADPAEQKAFDAMTPPVTGRPAVDAMNRLMENIVLPTYDMLDVFVGTGGAQAKSNYAFAVRPRSLRHLIGQVKLRLLQTNLLKELIETNNMISMRSRKPQYVILTDAKAPVGYESEIKVLLESSSQLSPIQELNARINLNLITAEAMKRPSQTGVSDDDPDTVTFE